jgi:transketolase
MVTRHPVPMRLISVVDEFTPTGSAAFLAEHIGITADGVCRAAQELLGMSAGSR